MWTLLDTVRERLVGPLPGLDAHVRMMPRPRNAADPTLALDALRPAAALVLIYPHQGTWHVPLTVRGLQLRHHTGQVSLPGGRLDPGESVEGAALREAHEEVGVVPAEIDLLGRLTPLPIDVSGHLLHPVVGVTPHRPSFRVAAGEVERLIEVPVTRLQEPDAVRWEQRTRPSGAVMDVPYFDVEGARVWGATAMVLAEFLALIGDRDVP